MEKLYVINVLAPEYYSNCAIKGSQNMPLNSLEHDVQKLEKEAKIIVYCAHYECEASRRAWQKLVDLGFKNIFAYEGGIVEWQQKGYPVIGSCDLFAEQVKKTYVKPAESTVREINAEDLYKLMQEHKLI